MIWQTIQQVMKENLKNKSVDGFQELRIARHLKETREKYKELKYYVQSELEAAGVDKNHPEYYLFVYFALVNNPTTHLHKIWKKISKGNEEEFSQLNPFERKSVCTFFDFVMISFMIFREDLAKNLDQKCLKSLKA